MSYRLERVTIEGFRGFGEREEFDCSGDVVILIGPNGWGKTSFFDAVTGALFGRIPRLLGTRDAVGEDLIRNRFLSDVEPNVSVSLTVDSEAVLVARDRTGLRVLTGSDELRGEDADIWVADLVAGSGFSDATVADKFFDDPESVFLRSVHLSQDQMSAFLRDASPRERFDTLASLLGLDTVRSFSSHIAGVGRDLGDRLDRSRTRERQFEQRLASLRAELDRTRETDDAAAVALDTLSTMYRELLGRLGQESVLSNIVPAGQDDANSLANAARDISVQLGAAADTEHTRSEELASLMSSREPILESVASMKELGDSQRAMTGELSNQSESLANLERQISEAAKSVEELRRRRDLAESENTKLVSLLSLARDHLSPEACPVCGQPIDVDRVTAGIDERLAGLPASLVDLQKELAVAEQRLLQTRNELATARDQASALEERASALTRRRSELARDVDRYGARLEAIGLGMEDANLEVRLSDAERAAGARELHLRSLANEAEVLARRFSALVNRERAAALLNLQTPLTADLEEITESSREFAAAGALADDILAAARRSEQRLMEEMFNAIQPTLSVLYGRLRPHPILDNLRLEVGSLGDRGEVRFVASSSGTAANVSNIFSSAQLNAVAVCIFLSMNLGMRSDVGFALLDDPIQNMDDFNVLGLLDVLKGLVGERQFVISTHDDQIGDLIRRKLRPTQAGRQTITHYFRAYRANGPLIESRTDTHTEEPSVLEAVAGA